MLLPLSVASKEKNRRIETLSNAKISDEICETSGIGATRIDESKKKKTNEGKFVD